ncbi:amidase domain-containing protein [Peribacillus alkalitolerans]|uniref:amidase domain-containing protein n=1 Tax=Peribacillus alkalitolerans TaxID=1550385 RepID=UPI0013D60464|nr:amidase domain-containing protein [Peribacillus alkalitolerans]
MRRELMDRLQERLFQYVGTSGLSVKDPRILKRIESYAKRNTEIVNVKAWGNIVDISHMDPETIVEYSVRYHFFLKQKEHFYIEEQQESRRAIFFQEDLIDDQEINVDFHQETGSEEFLWDEVRSSKVPFIYNRMKAIQYAERWWDSRNPRYQSFKDNCTNYISQCLRAGGAPIWGSPNRGKGFWYSGSSYSYSWAVAHSLKQYLSNSKTGLRAKKVARVTDLELGDIICYDFEGDGRYNHNTIITGRDDDGMPLVNANTYDSRKRYWAYEDSSAYTPNIKYTFFHIVDDERD